MDSLSNNQGSGMRALGVKQRKFCTSPVFKRIWKACRQKESEHFVDFLNQTSGKSKLCIRVFLFVPKWIMRVDRHQADA